MECPLEDLEFFWIRGISEAITQCLPTIGLITFTNWIDHIYNEVDYVYKNMIMNGLQVFCSVREKKANGIKAVGKKVYPFLISLK